MWFRLFSSFGHSLFAQLFRTPRLWRLSPRPSPRRDYAHDDRPSMARRSDLIGGRCLKCTNSRQRKMLAKRTRLNFVIGEVSRLPFERRIAPCRDDRMKSPTSLHLKSRGSSPAFTAALRQAASES